MISLDYWWSVYGLEETSDEYDDGLKGAHSRSAERILDGCLKVTLKIYNHLLFKRLILH